MNGMPTTGNECPSGRGLLENAPQCHIADKARSANALNMVLHEQAPDHIDAGQSPIPSFCDVPETVHALRFDVYH